MLLRAPGRCGTATNIMLAPGRARRPHLLPGDHDLVAVDHAPGLHRGQVGAVVRLGEPLAVAVLAGDDARQEARLLLGGAVHDDGRADQGLAHAAVHPRYPRPVELLVEHREVHRVHALAAVLFRPVRADQPPGRPAWPSTRRTRGAPGAGQPRAAVAAGRHHRVPVGELDQAQAASAPRSTPAARRGTARSPGQGQVPWESLLVGACLVMRFMSWAAGVPGSAGRPRCVPTVRSLNGTSRSVRGSLGRPEHALADDAALYLVGAAGDRRGRGWTAPGAAPGRRPACPARRACPPRRAPTSRCPGPPGPARSGRACSASPARSAACPRLRSAPSWPGSR